MDIAQLAQMVNWLDEEHRRDRAEDRAPPTAH